MKTDTNRIRPIKRHVHRHMQASFVPHKGNQYRPLLIRRYGIIAVLVLVFGLQFAHSYLTTGSVLGRAASIDTQALLLQTNGERTSHKVPALVRSAKLDAAAELKARDMFDNQYWAHTSPSGVEPWYWFKEADYTYAAAGENLAKNFNDAEATTRAWMQSPAHRQNILDAKYTEVGFATANGQLHGKQAAIVVALYGRPADTQVAGLGTMIPTVAADASKSPMARLGISLQSLSPITLASLMLIMFTAMTAAMAHVYRHQLPKHMRTTWYRHHGMIKASLLVVVLISMLYLYGGGQV